MWLAGISVNSWVVVLGEESVVVLVGSSVTAWVVLWATLWEQSSVMVSVDSLGTLWDELMVIASERKSVLRWEAEKSVILWVVLSEHHVCESHT